MVGEERKGAVPGFVHREEHFVSDQPQSDWKVETVTEVGRAEGLRDQDEQRVHPVSLLICWVVFSWSAGLFACWVVKCL